MLWESSKVEKSRLFAGILPRPFLKLIPMRFPVVFLSLFLGFFLNTALMLWAPVAKAQASNFDKSEGEISGTVLLEADKKPASEVAVSLKSRVAGIFRSVLTDIEGHFRVQHLPKGTYEIAVEEEGYEATRVSTQLDGPSTKLVMYLKSSGLSQAQKSQYMVSVRELKIPGKAQSEFQKGLERLAKNDPAGSMSHFIKAVRAFPGYYEAYYHLGVAEMRLGHTAEAEKEYQEAIDVSGGGYSWAEFGLGYLLCQEGKPGEAEKIIRRGLEVEDNSPQGYVILGDALLQLDRRDEAEKSAREALLRDPNFADAYLVLSNVDGRKEDYGAQLRDLDAYLKLDPNGPARERVLRGREAALRNLAKPHPQDSSPSIKNP
jgi:tetratricopeptide (TPR) repeat protein